MLCERLYQHYIGVIGGDNNDDGSVIIEIDNKYWSCWERIKAHHLLLDSAKDRHPEGSTLSDLELLAELQHFGSDTGLLDFTYNPLVALFFACKPSNKNNGKDGAVYCFNRMDTLHKKLNIVEITPDDVRLPIRDFFEDANKVFLWRPAKTNNQFISCEFF